MRSDVDHGEAARPTALATAGLVGVAAEMYREGASLREVAERLRAEHGVEVSYGAVRRALVAAPGVRLRRPGGRGDKPRKRRRRAARRQDVFRVPPAPAVPSGPPGSVAHDRDGGPQEDTREADRKAYNATVAWVRFAGNRGFDEFHLPRWLAEAVDTDTWRRKGVVVDREELAAAEDRDDAVRVAMLFDQGARLLLASTLATLFRVRYQPAAERAPITPPPMPADADDEALSKMGPAHMVFLLAGRMPPPDLGHGRDALDRALELLRGERPAE